MSNEHLEAAAYLLSGTTFSIPGTGEKRLIPPSELNIEMGKAQATLALAYEMRTANLLGLFIHTDAQGDMPDESADLIKEITERLGL